MSGKYKKLKSVKNGDSVEIRGEVFSVTSAARDQDSLSIRLDLQDHDGGTVTLIGVPGAQIRLPSQPA
ncbi:hypothetical protein [Paenarthrobacter sp. NPDC018779]|uniref:hypothetical protein n=1 Tax=Paenarthrobacter sp. NPDC018779 TaxID=3364375 RepID=UPI0037C6F36F